MLTHEEFMNLYDDSLRHGWVTSKDSAVAAKQKEREREYNHEYYQKHKDKWKTYQDNFNTGMDELRGTNKRQAANLPTDQLRARESAGMNNAIRSEAAASRSGKRKVERILNRASKSIRDAIKDAPRTLETGKRLVHDMIDILTGKGSSREKTQLELNRYQKVASGGRSRQSSVSDEVLERNRQLKIKTGGRSKGVTRRTLY